MKPALLVIDAQQEYFAPHGKWVLPDGEKALERIHALIAAARAVGAPVYYIRHESLEPEASVFRHGSVGATLHPSLAPTPGETVLVKHFPNAFAQTSLAAHLRQENVDTIIVSGYMTQLCCDTTTRAAEEYHFSAIFAGDATAARDLHLTGEIFTHEQIHAATLAIMTEFAEVLTTEKVIARLREELAGAG
ncbi:MAG TPA: cysteine hydrolase family protein [Ktedonobacterales bacterium]